MKIQIHEVVQLAQKVGVDLLKVLQDPFQLDEISLDEVVIEERGALVEDVIVRFRIEHVTLHIDPVFLNVVFVNEGHVAEGQGQVLLQYQPVMVPGIKSVAFRKLPARQLGWQGVQVLIVISHDQAPLLREVDLVFCHDEWITLRVPEDQVGLLHLEHLELRVLHHIPNGYGLIAELLSFIVCIGKVLNHNGDELRVAAGPDFADLAAERFDV